MKIKDQESHGKRITNVNWESFNVQSIYHCSETSIEKPILIIDRGILKRIRGQTYWLFYSMFWQLFSLLTSKLTY